MPEENMFTPLELYAAYPGADLIPIPPPVGEDTFSYYIDVVGKQTILSAGDTLYAFLLFELSDAETRDEAARRVRAAIDQLLAVEAAITRNI
jgi:hypothetical protein